MAGDELPGRRWEGECTTDAAKRKKKRESNPGNCRCWVLRQAVFSRYDSSFSWTGRDRLKFGLGTHFHPPSGFATE
jgi:hypothetical protein